mmetsp:Transcript_33648/g.66658  ORF Transcript_33648/g.66658 Transcript_33648/m.66658 type:complete len:102 (-) Transcript_33648:292-597(-)
MHACSFSSNLPSPSLLSSERALIGFLNSKESEDLFLFLLPWLTDSKERRDSRKKEIKGRNQTNKGGNVRMNERRSTRDSKEWSRSRTLRTTAEKQNSIKES